MITEMSNLACITLRSISTIRLESIIDHPVLNGRNALSDRRINYGRFCTAHSSWAVAMETRQRRVSVADSRPHRPTSKSRQVSHAETAYRDIALESDSI